MVFLVVLTSLHPAIPTLPVSYNILEGLDLYTNQYDTFHLTSSLASGVRLFEHREHGHSSLTGCGFRHSLWCRQIVHCALGMIVVQFSLTTAERPFTQLRCVSGMAGRILTSEDCSPVSAFCMQ